MTSEEWEQMKQHVNDAMRSYTRPLVTPLTMDRPAINKVTLEGTGNYVMVEGHRLILTCQHVAKRGDLDFRFYGSDNVFGFRGKWLMDPPPVDLAVAPMPDAQWAATPHQAQAIPYERFAKQHSICDVCNIPPILPRLPPNRTCPGHAKIDANAE